MKIGFFDDHIRIDDEVERHLTLVTETIVRTGQAIYLDKKSSDLMSNGVGLSIEEKRTLYTNATMSKFDFIFESSLSGKQFPIKILMQSNNDQFFVKDTKKKIVKVLTIAK